LNWRRKILASREGAAEGSVGGIPPRPSVPPKRLPAEASAQAGSGGGQFRSKNVRAELYNSTNIKLSDFCPTD